MCGICGAYGSVDRDVLGRMCAEIVHRGPDHQGEFYDARVMMGIRRLKVIDLETGNQPIYNEDRSVAIVHNGEIYNFKELRIELEEKGHIFTTHSDTESIVHLYEEVGNDFLRMLQGMFALSLWDVRRQRLILARDRIGIKPLYYYFKNGTLIFASEIKSILTHPEVSRGMNFGGLHDYLTYLYVPAPQTIFKDLYKLLPGHMLVCEEGDITVRQYWDILDGDIENSGQLDHDCEDLTSELMCRLKESVKGHLVSDVPLGIFLSGGTDSGAVVALASEVSDRPVKTFSVGFEDAYLNELKNARLVAKRYGTDHQEFVLEPPSIGVVDDIVSFFDEPFADSSAIPTYFVCKCAKEHVTVALSGDGGDEVFAGYGNYKADKITHWYRKLPTPLRDALIPFMANLIPESSDRFSKGDQIKKLLVMAAFPPEQGHVFWLSVFNEDLKRELYHSEKLRQLTCVNSLDRYIHYFEQFDGDPDYLNRFIFVDMKSVLPDDYLTKVDRMSMAHSLEVRVPLLDNRLLEFAAMLPSKYKLRGLTSKYLFKKAMSSRLPREIIHGRKKGFSMPLARWFRNDFAELINEYLSKDILKKRGYFSCDTVSALASEHLSDRVDNSKFLWTLICFEIWHRRYMD